MCMHTHSDYFQKMISRRRHFTRPPLPSSSRYIRLTTICLDFKPPKHFTDSGQLRQLQKTIKCIIILSNSMI
jgi:hypothetical protein